jgi:hypothetical protein
MEAFAPDVPGKQSLSLEHREDTMNRLNVTAIALLALAMALPGDQAAAQQMQRVAYKTLAANTKYTQQHFIDVGDVAGHQVRVNELYRTFPNDPPVINGLKLKEHWSRGMTDYTDTNGTGTNYQIFIMENGDKFFVRSTTVAQNIINPDGSKKAVATGTGFITGGTGKLAGITGIVRIVGVFDPKAGFNESQWEIEYAMGK